MSRATEGILSYCFGIVIVFQQIDVQDAYEANGNFGIRLFGVTEVSDHPPGRFEMIKVMYSDEDLGYRKDIVCLHISLIFYHISMFLYLAVFWNRISLV